jgi:hypothetical protein
MMIFFSSSKQMLLLVVALHSFAPVVGGGFWNTVQSNNPCKTFRRVVHNACCNNDCQQSCDWMDEHQCSRRRLGEPDDLDEELLEEGLLEEDEGKEIILDDQGRDLGRLGRWNPAVCSKYLGYECCIGASCSDEGGEGTYNANCVCVIPDNKQNEPPADETPANEPLINTCTAGEPCTDSNGSDGTCDSNGECSAIACNDPNGCGSSGGEPHFQKWNGKWYDFMGEVSCICFLLFFMCNIKHRHAIVSHHQRTLCCSPPPPFHNSSVTWS